MKLFLIIILLGCFNGRVMAQINFIDETNRLPSTGFFSWMQKGVSDMNNDGLDDIVRANMSGSFFILTQKSDSSFTETALGAMTNAAPLSVILGDIDNNNVNDILIGGQYNGVRILKSNATGSTFQSFRLPQDSVFTQASAMADINNDGLLDVFVCNDDSLNGIWLNTGGGNFVRDFSSFDFSTVPLDKLAGNYGIVFTDFDNDGDLDAYLSKCRAGVTDPSDPRRINQLFVNDGRNHFTDQAAAFGLKDDNQSWITEFQDIDNDGDMDAFIVNHHAPSRLLLNDGTGHFTEITTAAGLGSLPDGIFQALMRDFDNDGYVDLLCAGLTGAVLYRNNGDRTFTPQSLPLLAPSSNESLRSFVVGDLNHDGFQDIYASYFWGLQSPDRLWMNAKNGNHFLSVRLKGTVSNHSSVGARITIKANGKTQIREVRAGESYGISNSLTQYFGLGTTQIIDSLDVRWTSGQQIHLQNVAIDQNLTLTEPAPTQCIRISIKR